VSEFAAISDRAVAGCQYSSHKWRNGAVPAVLDARPRLGRPSADCFQGTLTAVESSLLECFRFSGRRCINQHLTGWIGKRESC